MKKVLFLAMASFIMLQIAFSQEVLQSGVWKKIDYKASGNWQLIQKKGEVYLVLDKNFKTKSGPDLHFLLSYKPIEELTNSNTSSNSKIIASLRSNRGFAEYKIPTNLDLKDFQSLVIHCIRYSHLWAGANLNL